MIEWFRAAMEYIFRVVFRLRCKYAVLTGVDCYLAYCVETEPIDTIPKYD